jgi:SAM-dependent methyltransferase
MSDLTVRLSRPGQDELADELIRDFHPATALDVGCGKGILVEALRSRGVDASGFDVSEDAISQAHESVAEHCRVASLTESIEGRYDLVTCIEVLEHLPPADTDAAIANLCAITDTIVMSGADGGLGEPNELDALPPEAWAAKFAEHGFMRDLERDLSHTSPPAAAFVRGRESQIETVRRYDRAWCRLRQEVAEVRRSLLESRRRLAELDAESSVDSETELLRLRDLLIGKEAELGVAIGKVAELEAQGGWKTGLKHRRNQIRGAIARVPGVKPLKRLIRRR